MAFDYNMILIIIIINCVKLSIILHVLLKKRLGLEKQMFGTDVQCLLFENRL